MNEKARIRREVLARRDRADDRLAHSAAIGRQVTTMPEYAEAATLSWFVGVKSEVMTLALIGDALTARRRVTVPWVAPDGLRLALINSLEELTPAPFGLLEPLEAIRNDRSREVAPADVDFFVVPGVAFDRHGGRLGHGKGYYDRLLSSARPEAQRTGICFEVQLVEAVPMAPTDVPMHHVVTELAIYHADGRVER